MSEWTETYRGVVNAWECDVVQHFTIAYYFDRFADATRNLLDAVSESGERLRSEPGHGPARSYATFHQELRAGAGFHILSAVTGVDGDTLRLGHQVIDTATGATATRLAETLHLPATLGAAARQRLAERAVPWPGSPMPGPPAVPALTAPTTALDRVKPWEIDEGGALSLPAHVHRFSAGAMQLMAMFGMTAAFMQEHKRGFSTFELDLTRLGEARAGEQVRVTTAVAHLGNSSLRIVHRMTADSGRDIAVLLQSGVLLDMEERRSTPIPPELRERIRELLSPRG